MQGPTFRCPPGSKVLTNFVNENYVSYLDIRSPLKVLKIGSYFKLRKATILKCRFCCFYSSYQLEAKSKHVSFSLWVSQTFDLLDWKGLYNLTWNYKWKDSHWPQYNCIALSQYVSYKKTCSNTVISLFPEKQSILKFDIWTRKPAECVIQRPFVSALFAILL